MCREVWDDTGGVISKTEASVSDLQQQPSQCTLAVTSIPQHTCHSSQSQQNAALLKPASVQQSSSTVSTSSLPSSVIRQADQSAGLLAQFQQLVESCRLPDCRLPDQASSDLMNWFSQQLHSIPNTMSLPSQQVWRHTDSVHVSSSDHGGTGTSEVSASEMYSIQNNYGALPAASVAAAQMPATLCSRETFCLNDAAAPDRLTTHLPTDHQYTICEVRSDSIDQQSLLAHLEQLQQMCLESAASALHNLYVLQQQVVPASGAVVYSIGTLSTDSTTAGIFVDAVRSQSSGCISRSN